MLNQKTHKLRQLKSLLAGVAVALTACGPASASPIFTQVTTNTAVFDGAAGSDRDAIFGNGQQLADDFSVASPATIRSVTWWGIVSHPTREVSPQGPWTFELLFYGDIDGLPDTSNVIGSSQVVFNTLTDTGENFGGGSSGYDIYVFTADVTPVNVSANTKYWFSVLADTSNDPNNNFSWRSAQNGNAVRRTGDDGIFTDPFFAENGAMLFILDDAVISETQPPSISRIEFIDGRIEVEFSGILQESGDLQEWADVTPQPTSPFSFIPSQDSLFFRARADPD